MTADIAAADLTPYVPRLLLQWHEREPDVRYRSIEGTLVFADVSGFTRLSEALARKSGKAGAEEMADVINYLFGELLMLAAVRGGEMLKYGGDAMLLFFSGELHAARAAAACADMQRRLREIGRVDTGGAGVVRLRMSVGAHSGRFDFFVAGAHHRELIVAGPATTVTVAMESAAEATEVLMSPAMAAQLGSRHRGAEKDGGVLLRGTPDAPVIEPVPLSATIDPFLFLAEPVAEHLASGAAEPEHRLVTVAFLQFLGLDALLDGGRTAEAASRVDDVVTLTQAAFLEFGVSFLATDLAADGAKVMAASGAPVSHGDDEERMLRACRRIVDRDPPLPVRVGLNRGHVFAGDVGPPFRRTYTTLGDVTNTAARVMGRAGPGDVFALAPVLDRSTATFAVTEQPPFLAKGKSVPLVPFKVGPVLEARRALRHHLPFTGRSRELALIAEAARASARPHQVDVAGEAGMGKTRLLSVLEAHLQRPVVLLTAERYRSESAFAAVGELLRDPLALAADAGEAELRAAVGAVDPGLLPWLPLIGSALGIQAAGTAAVDDLDPSFARARLLDVVGDLLVATHPPELVLAIDDAPWLDAASAEAIERLLGRPGAPPWVLVSTRRPEAPARLRLGEVTAIELGPLEPAEAAALAQVAGGERFMPDELERVVQRSGGNPMYLIELLAASSSGLDEAELPDTVEELLQTRIDRLPPPARRTLRLASVLGTTVEAALLSAAAGDELGWTGLDEFLEPTGEPGGYRFRQVLFRDVAYAGLPFRRRRELHRAIGDAIERRLGDAATEYETLSMHFDAAGDHTRNVRYSLLAAERARARFANTEATTFYRRALQSARRAGRSSQEIALMWQELALMLYYGGHYAEAAGAAKQGRRLVSSDPLLESRLLFMEGEALRRRGDVAASLRRYQRGIAVLAGEAGTEAAGSRSRLLNAAAQVRQFQARYRDAAELAQRSAAEAEAAGDVAAVALAHASSFTALVSLGDHDAAAAYRDLPARVFEEKNALWQLASFLTALGIAEYEAGRWEAAQEYYGRAAETARRAGDAHRQAVAANNRGEILSDQGQLDEALRAFDEALAVWRPAGYRLGVAVATLNRGRALGRLGATGDAIALIDGAVDDLRALGATEFAAYGAAWAAEAAAFGGQVDDAAARVVTARRRLPQGSTGIRLGVLIDRVEAVVAAGQGDVGASARLFARAADKARSAGLDYEEAVTYAVWAAQGVDPGPPEAGLADVEPVFRRHGVDSLPATPRRPVAAT